MILKHFTFSLSVAFISWIVGMLLNSILMKTKYYEQLSNLNFSEKKALNRIIGLGIFKWIVKNTPFKFFNPKLKLQAKADLNELQVLRKEMTFSELSHLLAFVSVAVFAIVTLIKGKYALALVMMVVNTLMNLYPSLLQQENKRRIDRFIAVMGSRVVC